MDHLDYGLPVIVTLVKSEPDMSSENWINELISFSMFDPILPFKRNKKKLFQCLAYFNSDILSSNPSTIQSAGNNTSQISMGLESLKET